MQGLIFVVRDRGALEARNLGFALARRAFFSLVGVMLPIWAVVAGLCMYVAYAFDAPLWGVFLALWCKPCYERPAVAQLSAFVFGEKMPFISTQKTLLVSGGLAEISWRRLRVRQRIVRHAVFCVENLRGKSARKRLKQLQTAWIEMGGFWFLQVVEAVVSISIILLVLSFFTEGSVRFWLEHLREYENLIYSLSWLLFWVYLPLSLLVSVYFVALGFAAYLNWRMDKEGWVLSIGLVEMAHRLGDKAEMPQSRQTSMSNTWLSLLGVVLLALMLGNAPIAQADENAHVIGNTPVDEDKVLAERFAKDAALVEELLQNPRITPYAHRHFSQNEAHKENQEKAFSLKFAEGFRFAVIALALILLGWWIGLIWRNNKRRFPAVMPKTVTEASDQVIGTGIAPMRPFDSAQLLVEQGQLVEALAVLYGLLWSGAGRVGLPTFVVGESERAYMARLERFAVLKEPVSKAQLACVKTLLQAWVLAVYAQRPVAVAEVGALIETFAKCFPALTESTTAYAANGE